MKKKNKCDLIKFRLIVKAPLNLIFLCRTHKFLFLNNKLVICKLNLVRLKIFCCKLFKINSNQKTKIMKNIIITIIILVMMKKLNLLNLQVNLKKKPYKHLHKIKNNYKMLVHKKKNIKINYLMRKNHRLNKNNKLIMIDLFMMILKTKITRN